MQVPHPTTSQHHAPPLQRPKKEADSRSVVGLVLSAAAAEIKGNRWHHWILAHLLALNFGPYYICW